MDKSTKNTTLSATRRQVLAGLAAGAGVTAAALSTVKAQEKSPVGKGPILFKRTAETERYYRTLTKK